MKKQITLDLSVESPIIGDRSATIGSLKKSVISDIREGNKITSMDDGFGGLPKAPFFGEPICDGKTVKIPYALIVAGAENQWEEAKLVIGNSNGVVPEIDASPIGELLDLENVMLRAESTMAIARERGLLPSPYDEVTFAITCADFTQPVATSFFARPVINEDDIATLAVNGNVVESVDALLSSPSKEAVLLLRGRILKPRVRVEMV